MLFKIVAQANLHLHSRYSNLDKERVSVMAGIFGLTKESHSDPNELYDKARDAGIEYFTLTDHDNPEGSFEMAAKHPKHAFSGVEATVYFPESRTPFHLLAYGFDFDQYKEINRLRSNVYELSEYVHQEGIIHSVAHPLYSVKGKAFEAGKLTLSEFCQLLLLFDNFETLNGMLSRRSNQIIKEIIDGFAQDQSHFNQMASEYSKIKLYGDSPWLKGQTAGSDDHSGLFSTSITTAASAYPESPGSYLLAIGLGQGRSLGKSCSPQSLAAGFYKIILDNFQDKTEKKAAKKLSVISVLTTLVFDHKKEKIEDATKIFTHGALAEWGLIKKTPLMTEFHELVKWLRDNRKNEPEEKIERLSKSLEKMFKITTEALIDFIENKFSGVAIETREAERTVIRFIYSLLSISPIFLSLRQLNKDHDLLKTVSDKFELSTDSLKIAVVGDLSGHHGPNKFHKRAAGEAIERGNGDYYRVFTDDESQDWPSNMIRLKSHTEFKLPLYDSLNIKIPDLLGLFKQLQEYQPDKIYISDPTPTGLAGLLAAYILNVPAIFLFHTDFAEQIRNISQDEQLIQIVEKGMQGFSSLCSEVWCTTQASARELAARGYPVEKIKVFPRGIDTVAFSPQDKNMSKEKLGARINTELMNKKILLYVGRISEDKNLLFLMQTFKEFEKNNKDAVLVLAGKGPIDYQKKLQIQAQGLPIYFAGEVPHQELATVYSAADVFVFPSTTDTLGMVVAEANACGVPAIVSDKQGPQEVIAPHKTGKVVALDHFAWAKAIQSYLDLSEEEKNILAIKCREHVLDKWNWDKAWKDYIGSGNKVVYGDRTKTYVIPEDLQNQLPPFLRQYEQKD